jgi:hypothetical protein
VATRSINVQVHSGILHIGTAAYPLRNIASVRMDAYRLRRWPYVRSFIGAVIGLVALGIGATVALHFIAGNQASSGYASPDTVQRYQSYAWDLVVAIIAIRAIFLVIRLVRARVFYALTVETAASSLALVATPDRRIISDLTDKITQALRQPDNPVFNFTQNVTTHDYGHKITQTGTGNAVRIGS